MKDSRASEVAVVMCTYNGAGYLEAQLESIATQRRRPAELLISDDGSTDATVALARSFAASVDFPVHVHVNPKNLGYGENFLQACLRASAPLIALCDQDDVWEPSKLERCQRALQDPAIFAVAHRASLIDRAGAFTGEFDQGITEERVLAPGEGHPWGIYFGFSMVFRRALLELIPLSERGPDCLDHNKQCSHDRWIYFLASTFGHIQLLEEPLVRYRQHGENQFGVDGRFSRLARVAEPREVAGRRRLSHLRTAQHRAALLERHVRSAADANERMRACEALLQWRLVAEVEMARCGVYEDSDAMRRSARLWENLTAGAYRSRAIGAFHWQSFIADLLACMK